ncbi:MAG: HNH endonuclease [Planctomycetaceae bacterium]|nr:HNH endonuclease [Planctomycetaceae bacterium]
MPFRSPRPCPRNGCPERTSGGPCARHRAEKDRALDERRDPRIVRLYRSKRWLILRREVLAAQPTCLSCREEGIVSRATEVDHVTPHRGNLQLFFERSNLQGLCKRHHGSKTAGEVWHGARLGGGPLSSPAEVAP